MVVSDREFILDPYKWPHLVLPLKRYVGHQMEVGFLCGDNTFNLRLGYIFDLGEDKGPDDFPVKKYNTVDELLADGWVVD